MSSPATQQPPQLFFQTINSYQRTEALKAAIELEVFTAIGEGNSAVPEIAKRCQTSQRGMRILCDYLCIMVFLAKDGGRYSLTQDSAVFLAASIQTERSSLRRPAGGSWPSRARCQAAKSRARTSKHSSGHFPS
jgi:Dimerisation domain